MSAEGVILGYRLWREWQRDKRLKQAITERAALFSEALDTPIHAVNGILDWDHIALTWWQYFTLGSETADPNLWLRVWWTWEMLTEEPPAGVWSKLVGEAPAQEKSLLLRKVGEAYQLEFPKGLPFFMQWLDGKRDEFIAFMEKTGQLSG